MSRNHKRLIRFFLWIVFIIYLAVLVYFLFLSESLGRGAAVEYRYNFEPGREIKRYIVNWRIIGIYYVVLNVFGNIVCFMPYGFIVPVLFRSQNRLIKVALLSFSSSALVELIQLTLRVGSCDVDDVILNTLGGILGYIGYRVIYCIILGKKKGRPDNETKETKK